jgi:uncharacterized membrane protein YccC
MTVLAIQTTLAGSIAVLVGSIGTDLFSIERPYWITLTAMMLIVGTFGETLKRAVECTLATLLGAFVGFILAVFLQRSADVEVAALFVCVFLITYTLPISYAWGVFWTTIALALLFTALSGVSSALLVALFTAILIGSVIGTVVAAIILPK